MMGPRQDDQAQFFYDFCLDAHVPERHILRDIEGVLDLSSLRAHLKPYYSHTGRPSICPELMIRMLIVGYCFGIRSERRLCEEVHLNLAYRWFCGLGLQGRIPDHSTFSKNRHGRFRDSDLLRHVFETVLARCIKEGLVGGESFGVDGSLIEADARRLRGVEPENGRLPESCDVTRAVADYLDVLDDEAFGAASEKTPKIISPTDPAARTTRAHSGKAFFGYITNYLVDLDHAVIVDVEPSTAIRQGETATAKRMIERTRERFDLYPEMLTADTGYGSGKMLDWLVNDQGIEPHIPVWDKATRKDGTYQRSDFAYDHEADAYTCPGGKTLKTTGTLRTDGQTMDYIASMTDCRACPLKERCCPKSLARRVPRSIYEGARDMAREIAQTEDYKISGKKRRKVEMLFAHLKKPLNFTRLRLRGPTGARDEFTLAATVQNLRKLAKLCTIDPKMTAPA